jgi:peptide/nickel transport system substrate-binding protein
MNILDVLRNRDELTGEAGGWVDAAMRTTMDDRYRKCRVTRGRIPRTAVALAALVAWLVVVGAGPASSAPRGKIVLAQGGEISNLDPHMHEELYAHNVENNIFDFLMHPVIKGGKLEHEPALATSWEAVNDTTWVFHLRKGVKFHNGEDFNAEAVKYSIERVLNPEQKARKKAYLAYIDRVEVQDPYTVRISTKGPSGTLIVSLGYALAILPPKYLKEKGDAYFLTHPVGTGPYKFVRWVKDEEIVLEANENYWAGPPNIKTVVFKPIPEDSARVAALLSGEVDIITGVPSHLRGMIDKSKRTHVEAASSPLSVHVHMDTLKEGPIQDKRVRQAINYGVDKETLIKYVHDGNGEALGSPLTPLHFGYDSSVKPYPYDPMKAKALLKDAGYASGLTVTLNSPSGRYPKDKEVAEAIAGQLAKVGITVKVQPHEWASYMKMMFSPEGAGPLYMVGWAGNLDADQILYGTLHCGAVFSRWCNKEFDRYLDHGRATLDQKERERLYSAAAQLVHEEAPWLFLYHGVDFYGVSNRVVNWKPTPHLQRVLYMYKAPGSFPSVKD